ncbi:MAG TPA: thermonuclease family protein [Nitrolancea sp.]|nr:thermonuclease family protein [Nitrolancea sp.]
MRWLHTVPQHAPLRGISHRICWMLIAFVIGCSGTACTGVSPMSTTVASRDTSTGSFRPTPSATSVPHSLTSLIDATVVRVVDGDTIIVDIDGSQERLRLIGMNTPELNKPDGPAECYATEATKRTQELVDAANGRVQLERDVSESDQYGRMLRYVWLVNPDGMQMLNEALVEGGFARAVTYRPDVKYQSILNREQNDAKNHNLGLWNVCH